MIEWFRDKKQLITENSKIRNGKKEIEKKYNELLEEIDSIQKKYINILEQKSDQFDLYIKYQNQCVDLAAEKKELKKQLADKTEECSVLSEENEKLTKKITKNSKKKVDKK